MTSKQNRPIQQNQPIQQNRFAMKATLERNAMNVTLKMDGSKLMEFACSPILPPFHPNGVGTDFSNEEIKVPFVPQNTYLLSLSCVRK